MTMFEIGRYAQNKIDRYNTNFIFFLGNMLELLKILNTNCLTVLKQNTKDGNRMIKTYSFFVFI